MSRRTVIAVSVVAVLGGGLAAPALAGPIERDDEDFTVCLITEPESGAREGLCVWIPDPLPR